MFSLAPAPPPFDPYAVEAYDSAVPLSMPMALNETGMPVEGQLPESAAALSAGEKNKGCRVKDRLDRKASLSYQWGDNRLEFKLRGDVGLSGAEFKGVKFYYRLALQPKKDKKAHCRYDSRWQGVAGSLYNELFLREENTLYDNYDEIKKEIVDEVEKFF